MGFLATNNAHSPFRKSNNRFNYIATLESIVLEFNQMSGPLPQELGNLTRLQKLSLTSNYFYGELPGTLAKLTTLKDFQIGDNLFTGSIPNFVQNWIHLQNLFIQASGLDGPIPSGIAVMTNMTKLRISDLNGTKVSTFPPLNNMRNLQSLILKSCNIIGSLPEYLETMNNLTTLDLSFNKLSGEIPSNFVNPSASISMYGLLILVFGFLVPVLDVDSLKPPKLNSLTDDFE
ncbi:probable LRR receptor-like serine/threonine-protein kinase At1g53420 [Camellia sinensis]|uniref:probable LRR receptor-like serine/threonine-protein kinase At1g53420 n=1 Tax=Camellia sinensis TaxID=4442 RepID=UPI001035FEF3|nr:probable LRR receptor-like serine/threonine-protein kinase At1g53420 [Camellia sinensis]